MIRNARFADALVEALKGDDERKESAAAGGTAERSAAATRDGGGGGGAVSANVSKNPTSKAPPPPPPPPALFRSLARHCESDATTRRCELSEASSSSGLGRATAEPDAFADPSDPSEPSEGGVGSAAPRPRFSPPIDAKNHPGAHYRVRRPETSVAAVTVAEFARCASAWTSRGAYLNDQIAGERRNEAEEGGVRAGFRSRAGGAGPSPLVLVDVGSRDRLALAPEVFRRKGRKGPRPDRSRTRRTDDPNGDPNAPEREDDFSSSDDDSDGDADDSGAETRDGAPRAGLGRFVLDRADGDALAAFASTCGFGSLRSVFFCAGTRDGLVPLHHPTSAFAEHSAWDRNETDFSRLSKPSSSSSPDASSPPPVAVAPSFASSDYAPTAHDREGRKAAASAAAAAADDEGFEALQVQVLGRRRVVLVSPAWSYEGAYPYPVSHPYDGRSMVDLDPGRVDYQKFGKFVRVRGDVAVLRPGDALFVPDRWWRHEHGASEAHAHAEFRFGGGAGAGASDASSILRVGRATEIAACDAEGDRDAKRWLEVVAEGAEAEWFDLGTVEGARRIDLAQRVRDEIDLGLGPGCYRGGGEGGGGGEKTRDDGDSIRAVVDDSDDGDEGFLEDPEDDFKRFKARRFKRGPAAARERETRPPPPPSSAAPIDRLARGRGRHRAFLKALLDGRMEPTHWLDADFVDPLFLSEAEAARTRAAAALSAAAAAAGSSDSEWTVVERPPVSEATAIAAAGGDSAAEGGALLLKALAPHERTTAVALAGGGYLGRARKVLPDDRDEVERAFPEMFVDELNKRGWTDVEHTPVSVLNPSHPEFIGDKSKVQRG